MAVETKKSYEVEVGRLLLQLKTKTPTEKDVFLVDMSNMGGEKHFLKLVIDYSPNSSQNLNIYSGCGGEPKPALPSEPGIWTVDPKDKTNYKASFNDEMVFIYESTKSKCNIRGLEGITRMVSFTDGKTVNTLITAFRTPGRYDTHNNLLETRTITINETCIIVSTIILACKCYSVTFC